MTRQVFYLQLSVDGIQKYICSTGKLKEMIGGSEIISYLASPAFYRPFLKDLHLEEDINASGEAGKYIVAQANAGALCLIMPSLASAHDFMRKASEALLADFPGLPFYGAICEFAWSDDKAGNIAYRQARKTAHQQITAQRKAAPTPQGSGLLPILRASRLDGLPAVMRDGEELISLPSAARRSKKMIEDSRQRLRNLVSDPDGLYLEWKDDLEDLLGGEGSKVALICMDGNDLGKLFGTRMDEGDDQGLCQYIRGMKELSETVAQCNRIAFKYACERIARYEAAHNPKKGGVVVMPLRPLVMGGDDITIIARADIALAFVDLFTRKFDEAGKKARLSLGIGMVVMDSSYPFAKAFPLAESLQDSAKSLTRNMEPGKRPSSLDYLVLTEDVENDIEAVRQRLFTCPSGEILTGKPFVLNENDKRFPEFLKNGCAVLSSLPRSQVREAWTVCRKGAAPVKRLWLNLKENISRGIGGRKGELMAKTRFLEIFPDNFFYMDPWSSKARTHLGDYLELERVLPGDKKSRDALLGMMLEPLGEGSNV